MKRKPRDTWRATIRRVETSLPVPGAAENAEPERWGWCWSKVCPSPAGRRRQLQCPACPGHPRLHSQVALFLSLPVRKSPNALKGQKTQNEYFIWWNSCIFYVVWIFFILMSINGICCAFLTLHSRDFPWQWNWANRDDFGPRIKSRKAGRHTGVQATWVQIQVGKL